MAISIEYVELRAEARTGENTSVTYAIAPLTERRNARLVDRTAAGAGLVLDLPVSPGRVLDLDLGGESRRASVRWIARGQDGFRVGVSFE